MPLIKLGIYGFSFLETRVVMDGSLSSINSLHMTLKSAELTIQSDEGSHVQVEDDPRITKIGRFIRRTSLDELPQFYNVLITVLFRV